MTEIRRMELADVEACERLWHESWNDLRRRSQLPEAEVTPLVVERMHARLRHLLATDPAESYVAEDEGRLVGLAQGLVRDGLWVLSLFAVSVDHQGRGIGRRLLEDAAGDRDRPGLILSSRDPRAARLYALAGFDLHPAVTAVGQLRRAALRVDGDITGVGTDALELVAEVDRRTRGASRHQDVEHLLAGGAQLLVSASGKGYAVIGDVGPMMLAAETEAAATDLLFAALAGARPDEQVQVRWLTAGQQWAITASLQAGLELHPSGPLMLRGVPAPPILSLPSGAFG